MELLLFVFLAFIISLIIGLIAIPNIVIIAKAKRLLDKPSSRKVHVDAVPRLGGISFFPSAMIAFCFALGIRYYFDFELPLEREGVFLTEFLFFIAGIFMLYIIGLADDIVGVGFRQKFFVQIVSASLLILAGLGIDSFEGLFLLNDPGEFITSTFTIISVVLVINAFNLIDGVDGLCSGISVIVLSTFGGWFAYIGEYVYAMMAFSMIGVVVTFFLYNVLGRRLKIFMGDTGSLTLGFMIAFLGLKFVSFDTSTYPDTIYLVSPLTLLGGVLFVPLFDTMRVFLSRIMKGKSPFHADKTHIHHKLLALGFSHLQSTSILLISTVCFLLLTILLSQVLGLNINIVFLINILVSVFINFMLNKLSARRDILMGGDSAVK